MAKKSVGIKELKDQASSIVEEVHRTRRPVTVTKNNRDVAQIIPLAVHGPVDVVQRLSQLGILAQPAQGHWKDLKLEKLGLDASIALAAIAGDRGDD